MPRMTQAEYLAYELRRKNRATSELPDTKPQCIVRNEPLAAKENQGPNAGRTIVRFVSYRLRLCDPDDLCPKYLLDGLRYAGLIPGDSEAEVDYERPRQVKVYHKKDERTEITIEAL